MNSSSKSILVTGGAGFIGSHLVEALLAGGASVTVLDCLSQQVLNNLDRNLSGVEFVSMNILSPYAKELLAERKFDIIYHLANNSHVPSSVTNPTSDLESNILSTFSILETIRIKSPETIFVYLSSAAVYGNPEKVPIDETMLLAPISPYGVSKLAAERYVAVYSSLYGLKTVTLRPFSVYGPRQTKQVIYDLIAKLSKNPLELELHGNGSQVRDFCYVTDAVNAILLVTEKSKLKGEAYNLASSEGYSILTLSQMIADVMGVKPRLIFSGSNRPGDPEVWVANINRLTEIGYRPLVGLYEGISKTYQWYLKNVVYDNARSMQAFVSEG